MSIDKCQEDVVIIVSDDTDVSTNKVMAFLDSVGISTFRLSPQSSNELYSSNTFEKIINQSRSIWLRRGDLPTIRTFHQSLFNEYKSLKYYIFYRMENSSKCLGSLIKEYDHNKLIDIEKAKKVGLRTPVTHIITSSEELNILLGTKNYITKSISDPMIIDQEDVRYNGGFTSEVAVETFDNDSNKYFPSLLQEQIDKVFEIRSFFIKGEFYSMAIFSQYDDQTRVVFRNYNRERPNRNVPFKLPYNIESKLTELMNILQLNTGSIDLIYSKQKEFVFLEVNPVGQYDWLSLNCNYNLDFRIAQILAS